MTLPTRRSALVAAGAIMVACPALARSGALPYSQEETVRVLLALVVILVAAKIGADLSVRIGQPPVLGELALGLAVGSLTLTGWHGLDYVKTDSSIETLSQIGVVLLLFQVGLESNLHEFLRLGLAASAAAVLGVAAPFVLGYLVSAWLMPHQSVYAHVFIGATLTATSVGITARVLRDLGKVHTPEARIILGAAVIDDVLGLIVLATVQCLALGAGTREHAFSWTVCASATFKALLFLATAIVAGVLVAPRVFKAASRLRAPDLLLAISLATCFLFAYAAGKIGLAPIVGAFAAGLVLDEVHWRDFVKRGEMRVDDLVRPIASFLVPIFFVVEGMRVNLAVVAVPGVALFAVVLILAAIIGKQLCGLAPFIRGANRVTIGLGMIPRGEVGLIFAGVGATLTVNGAPLIDAQVFAAVILMVMVTTFITPPLLRYVMVKR